MRLAITAITSREFSLGKLSIKMRTHSMACMAIYSTPLLPRSRPTKPSTQLSAKQICFLSAQQPDQLNEPTWRQRLNTTVPNHLQTQWKPFFPTTTSKESVTKLYPMTTRSAAKAKTELLPARSESMHSASVSANASTKISTMRISYLQPRSNWDSRIGS